MKAGDDAFRKPEQTSCAQADTEYSEGRNACGVKVQVPPPTPHVDVTTLQLRGGVCPPKRRWKCRFSSGLSSEFCPLEAAGAHCWWPSRTARWRPTGRLTLREVWLPLDSCARRARSRRSGTRAHPVVRGYCQGDLGRSGVEDCCCGNRAAFGTGRSGYVSPIVRCVATRSEWRWRGRERRGHLCR